MEGTVVAVSYPQAVADGTDGKFVMERQYRHAAGITAYELPCGVIEKGESPLARTALAVFQRDGRI